MLGFLWGVVVVLVILWLVLWLAAHLGPLVFIILAVAIILAFFGLINGRRAA